MKHSQVIDHPDRARIEHDLACGKPIRQMAKKYNLSLDVLYRYRSKIPVQLKAEAIGRRLKGSVDLEQLRIDESEGILTNLALQRARLLMSQDAALEAGDGRQVAYIADVIHRNVKLTGVYLGEFSKLAVKLNVNVLVSQEYLELRSDLMRALAPYPEARRAVAKALQAVEARAAEPKASPPVIEHEAVNAA